MNFNYILLGILALLFCMHCINGGLQEGQTNLNSDKSSEDRKTKFTLETDIMRKFGDGCCRHRGSTEGAKDKGYRTIPECLNLCVNDPNCWAADYKNPKGDKFQCTIYQNEEEPVDLHVECDKRTQCFKKVITGSAVCTLPQKCPAPPKEEKKLSAVVDSEEFEDKNEAEIKILDQIQKGLKEIVGLAVPPSACEDDPLACRPGALTEDQFAEWLKTEAELTKETCDEPDPSSKCNAKPASKCPSDDPEPPEKTLTESEISNVLRDRCEKQIAQKMVDPPNLKAPPQSAGKEKEEKEEKEEQKLTPKSPEIRVEKPQVQPHNDDRHWKNPISGSFSASSSGASSSASSSGASSSAASSAASSGKNTATDSASDGNWERVPHNHNSPQDGQNMYRELSTPAFKGRKKYVSLFE